MYKSLFERLKNYSSNPIDEYHKLKSFLENAIVDRYYDLYLSTLLSEAFLCCRELRSYFVSLEDCVKTNCSNLEKYQIPADYYLLLSENEKETALDEFLTFCQVQLTCLSYLKKNAQQILHNHYINNFESEVVVQFGELIGSSLNSFNYKCAFAKESLNVEIVLNNPVAEVIALESTKDISEAIIGFLSNRDIKTKEKYLHDFIDMLEPTLKKYSDQSLIKRTKEYIQLLRHPEIKKESKEYKWYFNNKRKYIDKLFELCLMVQQYDLCKQIIDDFENHKKGN